MALPLPTSTQYISFPTCPRNAVVIAWTEGRQARSTSYYVTKCYWGNTKTPKNDLTEEKIGNPESEQPSKNEEQETKSKDNKIGGNRPTIAIASSALKTTPNNDVKTVGGSGFQVIGKDPKVATKVIPSTNGSKNLSEILPPIQKSLNFGGSSFNSAKLKVPFQPSVTPKPKAMLGAVLEILGETRLFIAAEYVEPQYRGGPMTGYHVKDLAGFTDNTTGPNWITMQLNESFYYGQDGKQERLKRWLVYHPPIAATIQAPRMFQHRFTGLASAEFAKAALEESPHLVPDPYQTAAKAGGKVASYSVDIVKGVAGHYLHQFLGEEGIEKARSIQLKIDGKKGLSVHQLENEARNLLALQYVESMKVKTENAESDKLKGERAKDVAEYLDQVRQSSEKKRSRWAWYSNGKGTVDEAEKLEGLEGLKLAALCDEAASEVQDQDADNLVAEALTKELASTMAVGKVPRNNGKVTPAIAHLDEMDVAPVDQNEKPGNHQQEGVNEFKRGKQLFSIVSPRVENHQKGNNPKISSNPLVARQFS